MLKMATLSEAERLCKSDPVRPDISYDLRVAESCREVYFLESTYFSVSEDRYRPVIDSVLCLAYLKDIPINEDELLGMGYGNIAIFYTVWSHRKGAGRQIIFDTVDHLKKNNKGQMRYVTMSPKTEMAMKFHLNNGAILLQENEVTNNFEYVL